MAYLDGLPTETKVGLTRSLDETPLVQWLRQEEPRGRFGFGVSRLEMGLHIAYVQDHDGNEYLYRVQEWMLLLWYMLQDLAENHGASVQTSRAVQHVTAAQMRVLVEIVRTYCARHQLDPRDAHAAANLCIVTGILAALRPEGASVYPEGRDASVDRPAP